MMLITVAAISMGGMDATNELYSDRYPSGRLMKSWIHLSDTEFGPIPDVRRAARATDQISRAIIRDEFGSGSPIASH
jgi:hypothetical protein